MHTRTNAYIAAICCMLGGLCCAVVASNPPDRHSGQDFIDSNTPRYGGWWAYKMIDAQDPFVCGIYFVSHSDHLRTWSGCHVWCVLGEVAAYDFDNWPCDGVGPPVAIRAGLADVDGNGGAFWYPDTVQPACNSVLQLPVDCENANPGCEDWQAVNCGAVFPDGGIFIPNEAKWLAEFPSLMELLYTP